MRTFSKTYVLDFPIDTVFAAWVADDTVVAPAEKMEIEPRVGGTYRLLMPGGGSMEGVFSAFAENERVTYSWNWVGSDETTEVDVTFDTHPRGTEVSVTHAGFESAESHEVHASGWDSYLEGFKALLRNRD